MAFSSPYLLSSRSIYLINPVLFSPSARRFGANPVRWNLCRPNRKFFSVMATENKVFTSPEVAKSFDFASEERIYSWWEAQGCFKPSFDRGGDPFVIPMPPPNVTGSLHMGHAMFVTLEDIMVRYNRMKGRPTLWIPGTDHAGIATQLVVEKLLASEGIKRSELSREEFTKRVWEWKEKYGGTITSQIRRLGASCDWTREHFTLDEQLSRAVVEAFVKLHEKELIYQGSYMVNWLPNLQTAVSDLEVEYSEEPGSLFYIKYRVAGGSRLSNHSTSYAEAVFSTIPTLPNGLSMVSSTLASQPLDEVIGINLEAKPANESTMRSNSSNQDNTTIFKFGNNSSALAAAVQFPSADSAVPSTSLSNSAVGSTAASSLPLDSSRNQSAFAAKTLSDASNNLKFISSKSNKSDLLNPDNSANSLSSVTGFGGVRATHTESPTSRNSASLSLFKSTSGNGANSSFDTATTKVPSFENSSAAASSRFPSANGSQSSPTVLGASNNKFSFSSPKVDNTTSSELYNGIINSLSHNQEGDQVLHKEDPSTFTSAVKSICADNNMNLVPATATMCGNNAVDAGISNCDAVSGNQKLDFQMGKSEHKVLDPLSQLRHGNELKISYNGIRSSLTGTDGSTPTVLANFPSTSLFSKPSDLKSSIDSHAKYSKGFTFPPMPASFTSQPPPTPTMPGPLAQKPVIQKEHSMPPFFTSGSIGAKRALFSLPIKKANSHASVLEYGTSCFLAEDTVPLPPSLFVNASALEQLVLKSNLGLSGTIPPALGALHIPSFLEAIKILVVLGLSDCRLSDHVQTFLGALSNLTSLSLDRNRLDGTIPSASGAIPTLDQLNLSQNMFMNPPSHQITTLPFYLQAPPCLNAASSSSNGTPETREMMKSNSTDMRINYGALIGYLVWLLVAATTSGA